MGMASPCLKLLCKQNHQLTFKADNSLFQDSRSELFHKCLLGVGATTMKKLNPGLATAFDASVSNSLNLQSEATAKQARASLPAAGASSQQCSTSGESGTPSFTASQQFWDYGNWGGEAIPQIPRAAAATQAQQGQQVNAAATQPPARFRSREPTELQVMEDVDHVLEREMDTLEQMEG